MSGHCFSICFAGFALALALSAARCQQPPPPMQRVPDLTPNATDPHQPLTNVPYYIQSPVVTIDQQQQQVAPEAEVVAGPEVRRRSLGGRYNGLPPSGMRRVGGSSSRSQQQIPQQVVSSPIVSPTSNSATLGSPKPTLPLTSTNLDSSTSEQQQQQTPFKSQPSAQNECLYDRKHFEKLDECLTRRPYPTVGLPAFKNEDLLIKRGVGERHGCLFVLNNGLFKNYHINKYSQDTEGSCLDGSKVGLALGFSNTTISYLWSLRCLNHADQLLDDATLSGKTVTTPKDSKEQTGLNGTSDHSSNLGICVGSSQNFGFTSLQLSNLEAHVELAMDIYKNWRVTNITLNMVQPSAPSTARSTQIDAQSIGDTQSGDYQMLGIPPVGTNIRDFVFESLDGDELNWRYLQLYSNWSRNRMHTNFLDQYRRFLWISLQRCLSEASEKLPVKLFDVFSNNKYS